MTKGELFKEVEFDAACAEWPDCEIVVYYNTALEQFPNGVACLLITPRENLRTMDGEGEIERLWKHGDVFRVFKPGEGDAVAAARSAWLSKQELARAR